MAGDYWGTSSASTPTSIRAARVLMYVLGGLSCVLAVSLVIVYGTSGPVFSGAFVQLVPGLASIWLAIYLRPGRKGVWWSAIALQAVWLFFALGRLGNGDPSGIIGLIIPVVTLILLTRRSAREQANGPCGRRTALPRRTGEPARMSGLAAVPGYYSRWRDPP